MGRVVRRESSDKILVPYLEKVIMDRNHFGFFVHINDKKSLRNQWLRGEHSFGWLGVS